jgi:acyl-coenzyme A thioesterase PaaI-like protein
MSMLQLPHTAGCLVCGPDNPHGLHLSLFVNPDTGIVQTTFKASPHHIGFQGVIHGGILSTVADEAMVWTAIWASRRACLAGELNIRFKRKVTVDQTVQVTTGIIRWHSRLVETDCKLTSDGGDLIATGTAKYVPQETDETSAFFRTLLDNPETDAAAEMLRRPK